MAGIRGKTVEDRFWYRVDKKGPDECWEWTGGRTEYGKGYGKIFAFYHDIYTHRYSYILHFGVIPEGFYILHKCNNKGCVNPRHLYAGTQKENMADLNRAISERNPPNPLKLNK